MEQNNQNQANDFAEVVKKGVESFKEGVLLAAEHIQQADRTDLETFVTSYSKPIDRSILQAQVQEQLVYVAGTLELVALPANKMQLTSNLYFKNSNQAWINKKSQSGILDMDKYLNDGAMAQLNTARTMQFDIETPKVDTANGKL